MIVNDKYSFVFFQIPRTGSTAIAKVLLEKFSSKQVFKKHSSFEEYLNYDDSSIGHYFKFAGIRNPLDSLVSQYFKLKNDHKGNFSRGTYRRGKPIAELALEKYYFIKNTNAEFDEFYLKFHNKIYRKPQHENTLRYMDFIIRFDHLQEDFNSVTRQLNMPACEIPKINQTNNRGNDYREYYTKNIIPVVKNNLEEYMIKYGFSFPEEWQ